MKVHKVKSGNDYILYFAKSFRSGGNVTTRNIRKIGYLSQLEKEYDDPIAHFKEEAKKLTLQEKEDSKPFTIEQNVPLDPTVKRNVKFGYVFPQKIWYALSLDSTMRHIKSSSKVEFDVNRIVRDLVIGRILEPCSKLSSFELAKSFYEKPNYNLHHIYRCLSLVSKNFESIQQKAFIGAKKYAKTDASICYYDCTNFYFEIEEEDGFRTYGKSKENRPNPIVEMGLFLDRNGLPISMRIHPGRTNEQKTMIPLEKQMEEQYGIKKFVVCADCGLSSKKNLKYNSSENHAFVVTKSLKKMKEEVRNKLMKDDGWKLFNDKTNTTYKLSELRQQDALKDKIVYHDEWFNDDNGFNERIIITYSERTREYQRHIREEQIQRALKLISEGKLRKGKNQNDARRFINEEHITNNGEVAENTILSIDEELFNKESYYDGYYAVTTNLDDSTDEIIRINKGRWEIEESFRIMKTDFEARPVYLAREDRIKSHFLICYLALLIFRIIEQKLKEKGHYYTSAQIINSIKKYDMQDMGYFYIGSMEGEATKALEETFNISLSYQGLKKQAVKKIYAETKKI